MLLAALLLTLVPQPDAPRSASPGAEDVGPWLARLADPDGGVRRDAERWLARHVGPEHASPLAAAARAGDAEVRLRIARIVADASPDLWLATLFLGRDDPELVALGERALLARLARWNDAPARAPLVAEGPDGVGPYHDAVRETASRSWPQVVRLEVEGTLEDACARLMRRGHMPLGVAVDPALEERTRTLAGAAAPAPERRTLALEGTWDAILLELSERYRVGLEAHGMLDEVPAHAGPAAFLCFRPVADAGRASAEELVLGWCRTVLADGDPAARAAAARALAAVRWPAALAWLGARWSRLGDEAALSGLLRAAGEGRVAAALLDAARWPALFARIERGLSGDDAQERLWSERALDGLGDLPGAGGRAQAALVGWEDAGEAGRWLRLVILEGMASTVGAAPAREVLETRGVSARLLHQALRTWVASTAGATVSGPPPSVASPGSLLGLAEDFDAAHALLALLRAADLAPPRTWRDPATAPRRGPIGALCLVAWWGQRGDARAVAEHWAWIVAGPGADAGPRIEPAALAAFVAPLALHDAHTWREAWELARAAGPAVDRSALLARLLPRERAVGLFEALVGPTGAVAAAPQGGSLAGVDLELVGVAARWMDAPVGERARDELAARWLLALREDRDPQRAAALIATLSEVLVALERDDLALTRAFEGDSVSDAFRRRIEGALRAHRRTRIAQSLGAPALPRQPPPPVSLARQDRRW